jgi:hypothetical protein
MSYALIRWFEKFKELDKDVEMLLSPKSEFSVFDIVFATELKEFKVVVPVAELDVRFWPFRAGGFL